MKKIVSFSIIVGGVVVSFVILRSPSLRVSSWDIVAVPSESKNAQLSFERFSHRESPSFSITQQPSFSVITSSTDGNLTIALAKSYAQRLAMLDTADAPSLEQATTEALKNQNYRFDSSHIFTLKNIAVSSSTAQGEETRYLTSFQEIIRRYARVPKTNFLAAITKVFQNKNTNNLKEHINAAQQLLNDGQALIVPATLTSFHLNYLNTIGKQLSIYEALVDFENDPLKATLAFQELFPLVQEVYALQKSFKEQLALRIKQ